MSGELGGGVDLYPSHYTISNSPSQTLGVPVTKRQTLVLHSHWVLTLAGWHKFSPNEASIPECLMIELCVLTYYSLWPFCSLLLFELWVFGWRPFIWDLYKVFWRTTTEVKPLLLQVHFCALGLEDNLCCCCFTYFWDMASLWPVIHQEGYAN